MSSDANRPGFVQGRLPWILGAGALVVFLLTLNQWVSLRSLNYVARVSGWETDLPILWPLFYTVTFPFRFLPDSIQPLVLNLFATVCATLTVVLLARSVALLPHDRTHDQRIRERSEFSLLSIRFAWVPIVLASAALSFQLSFWENATSLTPEMLNLLLFAYVIRCLLEYRISHEERWLLKMAFVYGLAVTNNWAMIGYFPLVLGALIWIKGVRFFDPGFLLPMGLCGVAGLLLYLVLPTAWAIQGGEHSFWGVLKTNWLYQKVYLTDSRLRTPALLLGLTSVLPVILMGIRWRTHEGDTNVAASMLTNIAFRVIHLFFLATCLWIAFDPKYSPRFLGKGMTPFLSFYYLGALAIGYYSGYALLVFSEAPRRGRAHESPIEKLLNPIVQFAVLAAMVFVPVGLLSKNFARVRGDNGSVLKAFATRLAESLPPAPAFVFADVDPAEPNLLSVVQAHFGTTGKRNDYVFVNTSFLNKPQYHRQLRQKYGERWPFNVADDENLATTIAETDLQLLVRMLSSSNTVAYLHPSFGYFFEAVYPVSNRESFRLAPFASEQYIAPPSSPEQLAANDSYWKGSMDYFKTVRELSAAKSVDALWISRYYSRALNTWGVELQRAGKIKESAPYLAEAVTLNTNNIPARSNLEVNRAVQAGTAPRSFGRTLEERFGEYRSWERILADNGPFEHPEFCAPYGQTLLNQQLFRQAALQFSRVIAYQPTNFVGRLGFVSSLIGGNWLDPALTELEKMDRDFASAPESYKVELVRLRAAAYFSRQDFATAEQVLKKARAEMPGQTALAESMFALYRDTGNLTSAMAVVNEQLARTPTNAIVHLQKAELQLATRDFVGAHQTLDRVLTMQPKNAPAHLLHAFAYMQEREYDKAIAVLDRLLRDDSDNEQALLYKGNANFEKGDLDAARKAFNAILLKEPNHQVALRNRAVINLRAKRWSEARDDYERLQKLTPRSHTVMYGLGEVAAEEGRNADAIRYYEAYLRFAPAQGGPELDAEKQHVRERIEQLRNPSK